MTIKESFEPLALGLPSNHGAQREIAGALSHDVVRKVEAAIASRQQTSSMAQTAVNGAVDFDLMISGLRNVLNKEKSRLESRLETVQVKQAVAGAAIRILELFQLPSVKLEPVKDTRCHKLMATLADTARPIIVLGESTDRVVVGAPPANNGATRYMSEQLQAAHIFLLQHDWAAAFAKSDMTGEEIKAPYESVIFETQINGVAVLRILGMNISIKSGQVVTEATLFGANDHWAIIVPTDPIDFQQAPIMREIDAQIRAVCIALDAEVASATLIRQPHKLNHAREKAGKPRLLDYHVVNLAHRTRAPRLAPEAGHEPAWHPRLHFRRGHWRHFESHKTWINWMLVGDPDLGFIEKHYRL